MKRLLCVLLVILLVPLLCGCSSTKKDEMYALDTIISFELHAKYESSCDYLVNEAKDEITRLEDLFSTSISHSDIYRINHSNGEPVQVSEETADIIRTAREISRLTDGAFDISVYELVKLWGFDTKNYHVPTDKEIEETLKKTGYENIEITEDNVVTVKNGVKLDLGGIAKGYIMECIDTEIGSDWDFIGALINMGGMVDTMGHNRNRGDDKWIIGIEYPGSGGDYFATFYDRDATTSGAYQRYFEEGGKKYHHIIDPKTGKPAESDLSSVTITNPCSSYTDALSTAFYIMGKDKTIEFIKNHNYSEDQPYSVILLSKDKKDVYITEDMIDANFELANGYEDEINVHVIKLK